MSDDWLQNRAKAMRREPALYERRLWKILRDRQLEGMKFNRQKIIGSYIVDFVCFRHRLIVEADGPLHDDRAEYDAARDAWLVGEGFRVLRFRNQQIETRDHEVVATILAAVSKNVVRD